MSQLRTPGPWTTKQLTPYSTAWVLLWPSAAGQHMKRIDRAGEFMEGDALLLAAAPKLLKFAEAMRDSHAAGSWQHREACAVIAAATGQACATSPQR